MSPPTWLDDLYGHLRCVNCSHRLKRVEAVGENRLGPLLLIGFRCARCGCPNLLYLYGQPPAKPEREPLTGDDVLNAHDALKAEHVRLTDLIGEVKP